MTARCSWCTAGVGVFMWEDTLTLAMPPADCRTRLDLSERSGHEYAVRVGLIIREWLAVFESELLVQIPGGQEQPGRAGLETEPGESHASGLGDDVLQKH